MTDLPVRLRPFQEADLALLDRLAVDRSLSEPFSWFGFRWADGFRRRWEEGGLLDRSPYFLAVALDDGKAIGWVNWRENDRPRPGVWEIRRTDRSGRRLTARQPTPPCRGCAPTH